MQVMVLLFSLDGCIFNKMAGMEYKDGLETERLITRFVTPNDLPAWMEYCNDPIATTFTKRDETPEELAQRFIDFTLKRHAEGLYGLQALITKDTGQHIGMCGIMVQEVNGKEEIEVGYHLIRRHWGKGYATEAAQMFRNYGFEHNVADSIISIIHPQNVQSKAVALRNGMRLVETNAIFREREYHLYRIARKEWETMRSA